LIVAIALECAILAARAQGNIPNIPLPPLPSGQEPPPFPQKESPLVEQYPQGPTQPPAFRIPFRPLGFSPPGPFYLLRRQSLVSLDFLDENHLLFSFQVQQL